jgi:hypothetical protein
LLGIDRWPTGSQTGNGGSELGRPDHGWARQPVWVFGYDRQFSIFISIYFKFDH